MTINSYPYNKYLGQPILHMVALVKNLMLHDFLQQKLLKLVRLFLQSNIWKKIKFL